MRQSLVRFLVTSSLLATAATAQAQIVPINTGGLATGNFPIFTLDTCAFPPDSVCTDPTLWSNPSPSTCQVTQKKACGPRIKKMWDTQVPSAGVSKKMFPIEAVTDPKYLHDGRFEPYAGSGFGVISNSGATYNSDVLWYRAPMVNADLAPWRPYFRYGTQFESDGTKITSCKEYAYKSLWDYNEFQDDATLCVGDGRCVYNAVFNGAHSIARKTLHQVDQVTPIIHGIDLRSDLLPKNDFFLVSNDALMAAPGEEADVAAIRNILSGGVEYYGIGTGGSSDYFNTEWDYHQAMHDRLDAMALSDAELEDVARRTAAIRSAMNDYILLLGKMVRMVNTPMGLPSLVPGPDPVEEIDPATLDADPIMASQAIRLQLGKAVARGAIPASSIDVNIGRTVAELQQNALTGGTVAGPAISPFGIATAPGTKAFVIQDTSFIGVKRKLTSLLLDEYSRLKRGQRSCLNLDSSDVHCDWSYSGFASRFTHLYDSENEQAKAECTELVGPSFEVTPLISLPDTLGNVTSNAKPFHDWMTKTRAALRAEFTAVPQYPGGGRGIIGMHKADGHEIGDESWFAAGYNYDIGWKIWKSKTVSASDARACAFSGESHATVSATAHLLGKSIGIVDSDTHLTIDPVTTKQSVLASHTSILGNNLYDPVNESRPASHSWNVAGGDQSQRIDGPSTVIMIGPVPVTFSAYAEAHYGGNLIASVGATDACASGTIPSGGPRPQFGLNLDFAPYANVDAVGEAAAGIPDVFTAGFRGDITLVHVSVPMSGGANIAESTPGSGNLVLRFDTQGDLSIDELGGKASVFVEALGGIFGLEYEKEVFHWNGFHQSPNLWSVKHDIDLSAFRMAKMP
jgi:hypothetical protein